MSAYLEDSLRRKVIFFTGKGGVGKTTMAWATAVACQKSGKRVAVAGWNPYTESTDTIPEVLRAGFPEIEWVPLDTLSAFREYALQIVKFNTVYDMVFENHVLKTFIQVAPGLSESVIGGKLWNMCSTSKADIVIVDLPASGHAISFFKSPMGLQKIFKFGFVRRDLERVTELFQSPSTRLDLIAMPEDLATEECRQLYETLSGLYTFNFGYVHMNQTSPNFELPEKSFVRSEVHSLYDAHRILDSKDEERLEWLRKNIGLPILQYDRLPNESAVTTVRNLAETLLKKGAPTERAS